MDITLNVRVSGALQKKLTNTVEEINKDYATKLAIHNTLAKRCDPYVPFLNGPLSQTIQITADGVRYVTPYARYQYYGDGFKHTLEYHPLATSRWDQAMLMDHREEFDKEVEQIIRGQWLRRRK